MAKWQRAMLSLLTAGWAEGRERAGKQENQDKIQEYIGKLCSSALQSVPRPVGNHREGSETHPHLSANGSSASSKPLPFPNHQLVFGCSYCEPWLSLRLIPAPTVPMAAAHQGPDSLWVGLCPASSLAGCSPSEPEEVHLW